MANNNQQGELFQSHDQSSNSVGPPKEQVEGGYYPVPEAQRESNEFFENNQEKKLFAEVCLVAYANHGNALYDETNKQNIKISVRNYTARERADHEKDYQEARKNTDQLEITALSNFGRLIDVPVQVVTKKDSRSGWLVEPTQAELDEKFHESWEQFKSANSILLENANSGRELSKLLAAGQATITIPRSLRPDLPQKEIRLNGRIASWPEFSNRLLDFSFVEADQIDAVYQSVRDLGLACVAFGVLNQRDDYEFQEKPAGSSLISKSPALSKDPENARFRALMKDIKKGEDGDQKVLAAAKLLWERAFTNPVVASSGLLPVGIDNFEQFDESLGKSGPDKDVYVRRVARLKDILGSMRSDMLGQDQDDPNAS
jgi:hypothetical protein